MLRYEEFLWFVMTVINWVYVMIEYEKLLCRQSGGFLSYFHEVSTADPASFDWFYRVIYPSGVFLCSLGVIPCCLLSVTPVQHIIYSIYTPYIRQLSFDAQGPPFSLLTLQKGKIFTISEDILIWLIAHNDGKLQGWLELFFYTQKLT